MSISNQWLHKFNPSTPLKLLEVNPAFKPLESFIIQLPDHFHSLNQTIYKSRNELKLFTTPRQKIVIKHFGKIYLANRLIYAWIRPSKAKRSFENALRLRNKGIDTPYPIAYIECYNKGIIGQNMYLYVYCPATIDMRQVLADENFPDRKKILQEFARFTFSLNQKQVYHRDYNPSNILFEKREGDYHFILIDINRITFGKITERKKYRVFRRFLTDEKTLQIIGKEYATLYHEDEKYVTQRIIAYRNRFIQKKSRKKSLKKILQIG